MSTAVSLGKEYGDKPEAAEPGELPYALPIELTVKDPETIAELCVHEEGEPREQFALKALRVGVLALKQARGEIDVERIRRESERLLATMQNRLSEHATLVQERLTTLLKDYFDPSDGRFEDRVQRLLKQDGELEQTLRRQVGSQDSELCKTLAAHFGEDSPLMKLLSPDQSRGLLAALRDTLAEQLAAQREHVLRQFSLDNKDGALSRFISQLAERQGQLSGELHGKLDQVVRQFSLDDENTALSRLVRNVTAAQRTISNEFSLDAEASALSRLKKILEDTNTAVHNHLSLDREDSALARLKRELLTLLGEHRDTNLKFQEEVRGTLQSMLARREEAGRSTRHGIEFEDAVFDAIQREAQRVGDLAVPTGSTVGQIRNCKIGDCAVELGPDSAAPAARIVVEAKEKAGYDMIAARDEIETGRKNRAAQVGLFVFSKRTAPDGLEPISRFGHDVFVVWDSNDIRSDIYLRVGLSLARALCVRSRSQQRSQQADFSEIDRAILEIEKQAKGLDDMENWTKTIQNNSEKLLHKLDIVRRSIEKQLAVLRERTDELKSVLAADPIES